MKISTAYNSLTNFIIYVLLFIQYAGTGYPAFIIISILFLFEAYRKKSINLNSNDLLLIGFGLFLFMVKLIKMPLLANTVLFKFYWGFIIFYIFFKNRNNNLDFELILILASISVIIDFVLINYFIPLNKMPNIPNIETNFAPYTKYFGFYKPYGLGSNPTVTATIIIVILSIKASLTENKSVKNLFLPFLALIFCVSGTGFILFLIYIIIEYKLFKKKSLVWLAIILISSLISIYFFIDLSKYPVLAKISNQYISFLFNLKWGQFIDALTVLNESVYNFLFGASFYNTKDLMIMSDFGWANFLTSYGFLGFFLFFLFLVIKINKYNKLPILIFIIGAVHYPAIFSVPGQLLFGYLFALNPNSRYNSQDK